MEVPARPTGDILRRNPQHDFELVQRVGSGTYGDVYKARNLHTGELAAVKIIKLEPGDDFSLIQQEIYMVKECKHCNIVAYFGSYLSREKLWICMEYCGGGSLQDIYHGLCFSKGEKIENDDLGFIELNEDFLRMDIFKGRGWKNSLDKQTFWRKQGNEIKSKE